MKKRIAAAAAFLALVLLILPVPARADVVTDTITIGVGYYGWSEDQYIEKATYHWTELDDWYGGSLDTHDVIYSYYSGSRTYLVAARGFYVRDLLYYAGIDVGSVASIDFFTRDHANGAYRSFSAYSLLYMPRYYFPNLAANEETGEIYAYDDDDIWNGATYVESMLALEDYTEWDVPGAEFEQLYDPSMLSPNARFHLFFGQADPSEASTSSAAKYCYKILITFAGTPVLSTDQTDMELKIGSGRKIDLYIDAEDGLLNEYVRNNIVWSSSDESVVSVAPDGTVTVLSEGDAVITASFENSSVSVNVHVAADAAPNESAGPANGEGEGDSPGDGTGSQTRPEDSPGQTQQPTEPGPDTEPPPENDPPDSASEVTLPERPAEVLPITGRQILAISPKALAGAMQGNIDPAYDAAGSKMDEDSTQLVITLPEKPAVGAVSAAALGAAFTLGVVWELLRYRKLKR